MQSSLRVVRGTVVGVGLAIGCGVLAACGGAAPTRDSLAVAVASPTVSSSDASPPCMDPAQVQEYWERYGKDPKHIPNCPDPDPLPDTTRSAEPSSDGPPPELPTTLADAQQFYDPENDPFILLVLLPDGTYTSRLYTYAPGSIPPPSVKTVEQYIEWAASRNGKGSRSGKGS